MRENLETAWKAPGRDQRCRPAAWEVDQMHTLGSWGRHRTLATLLAGLAGLVGVATGGAAPRGPANASACAVSFAIADGGVAASVWPNGTVGLAIPLTNEAKAVARDVRITAIQASSG